MITHVIINKSDTEGERRTQYRELKLRERESLFFYDTKNLKFCRFYSNSISTNLKCTCERGKEWEIWERHATDEKKIVFEKKLQVQVFRKWLQIYATDLDSVIR